VTMLTAIPSAERLSKRSTASCTLRRLPITQCESIM
jgi:hypothetical protein